MRLEVLCEDRLGLTRELLDILASKSIDLRGIEIDISGIIYLNCPDIDFAKLGCRPDKVDIFPAILFSSEK